MKKFMIIFVCLLYASTTAGFAAATDITGPVISNITISGDASFHPGDTMTITAEVTDDSDIDYVSVGYFMMGSGNGKGHDLKHVSGNLYRADITIPEDIRIGEYYITIHANDIYGNGNLKEVSPAFSVEQTSSNVSLPGNLEYIGEEVFSGTNCASYVLPSGLTIIPCC